MILLSHPSGNAFVRAILSGLEEAGQLHSFHTTVSFHHSDFLVRLAPEPLKNELLRRSFAVPPSRTVVHPIRELVRLSSSRLGLGFLLAGKESFASIDAIYEDLDRQVAEFIKSDRAKTKDSPANKTITAVYCYEDCAAQTFKTAAVLGLKRFYDLPIAYWQTSQSLLAEEAARLPAWEPTLIATADPPEKLERKTAEIELSDVVICPSQFVLNSLPASIRQNKTCLVSEFGSPKLNFSRELPACPKANLRVLFAGSLSQRKGLSDVFTAMQMIKRADVELIVMGSLVLPLAFYRSQFPSFVYEPPRPHDEVLKLMSTCDILVLPSIVEGRALVQQEAMMCGLPLIVTANAGGEDLIEEGKTGFLVPIRCPERIAEKISWFADNRDALEQMRELARQKATSLTWQNYARKILAVISGTT